MRIDAKAEHYVGEPTYNDPTSRSVFGDPARKPVEDWGWLRPANRLSVIEHQPDLTSVPPIRRGGFQRSIQIIHNFSTEKKAPTITASRLTEIQDELMTLRESLGRRFKTNEDVIRLKEEQKRLVRERRKEKSLEGR